MAAVDDPKGATRFEIQLTPNERSRLRRRRLAGTGAEVVAHDHPSDLMPPEADARAISPDDRWAPMMLSNDQPQFGLIDMTTGRFIALADHPPSGWWWSQDGRFAIYNENSTLKLFDTQQLTTIEIAPDGIAVDAFAVRPAA